MNTALESREQAAPEVRSAVSTLPEPESKNILTIRPLAQRDRYAGHDLQQVWRKDNVAVFSRSFPSKTPHEYEVIIVRIAKASTLPDGTNVPKRETYPSPNQWGTYGWSIPKQDQAITWAEMILANLAKPQRERTAWPELFSHFKRSLVRN